jgi:hypothetical protein
MPRIPHFAKRWSYYKPRARKIVPLHFSEGTGHKEAAKWIPKDEDAPFPAGSDGSITDAAFGLWITGKGGIPDQGRREEHFAKLTGLSIGIWTEPDDATFERAVRRAATEALSWRELAERARAGVIRIVPVSEPPPPQPAMRFIPAHARRHRGDVEVVWPGCQARIDVPLARPSPEGDDRRVWMLAEYPNNAVYILDPAPPPAGGRPASHISPAVWRPRGMNGYVMLPRGKPDYVKIDECEPPGTRFDLFVLVINLSEEVEEVRAQFDAVELRLFQQTGGELLDDAASLLEEHGITPVLYRQACVVEHRYHGEET